MIILRDTTGVTVKRRIQDLNHVRFGVTQRAFWSDGVRRCVSDMPKPHGELTIDDCIDALVAMERLARLSGE